MISQHPYPRVRHEGMVPSHEEHAPRRRCDDRQHSAGQHDPPPFALRALREDVRTRATYVASELAFGITTRAELEDAGLLAAQIRNTLAARPTLRWIEVYAASSGGLSRVASSIGAGVACRISPRKSSPPDAP